MDRTELEEYIFGSILLIANKIQIWGDNILQDLTLKQWYLLMLISKMNNKNPSINDISEFSGTSRQNVKKILEQLGKKNFVKIRRSKTDARTLNVSLTKKTYNYFTENEKKDADIVNNIFSKITDEELKFTKLTIDKLHFYFGNLTLEEINKKEYSK